MAATANLDSRLLPRSGHPAAVELFTLGMRDNPLHRRVFGADPEARPRRMRPLMAAFVDLIQRRGELRALCTEGEPIALLGLLPPG